MLKKLSILLLSALMVIACSSSVDSEKNRFNMAKDKLDVIASQNPALKATITAKVAEFQAEFQNVLAGNSDDQAKIKALGSLNYRVSQYTTQIEPKKPASKLNQTATPPVVPVGSGIGAQPTTKTGLGTQPATNGLGTQPATNGLGTQPATNGLGTQPALDQLGKKTDTSSVPALDSLGTKPATNTSVPALDGLGTKPATNTAPALDSLGTKPATKTAPALDSKMGTSTSPSTKSSKLPSSKKSGKLK